MLEPNFNLPPGVTNREISGLESPEDYFDREAERADQWHDQAVDREADKVVTTRYE